LLFRPNEIGNSCLVPHPKIHSTGSKKCTISIQITSPSADVADVWNWKWGGIDLPATELPLIIVVVSADFNVAFPSCGKRTS
jgi:hypothetical protein